jgi:RHS repeat-associated protein
MGDPFFEQCIGLTPFLIQQSFGFDAASRLASVTDLLDNNSATYSYVANSPLVGQISFKQSSAARMMTTKQYDDLNRLTTISSQPGASGVPPVAFNYNYNSANQRTQDKLADGSYWVYQYDSLGQVISGCKYFYDNTPVPGQQFDYSFDTIGNRMQTKAGGDQTGGNQRLATYLVNNLNQITSRDYPGTNDIIGAALATNSVTVNGQTAFHKGEYFWGTVNANNTASPVWLTATAASGGSSTTGNVFMPQTPEQFSYDADGNLTNDGRWSYTWDAENRLVAMTNNTGVGPLYGLTFAYDAKGRRIQKSITTDGVSFTTQSFLYDGWNLVGTLNSSFSLLNSFMWGSDLSGSPQGAGGVGGLLEVSEVSNSQITNCFAAYDGNGNLAALINAADGTSVANYEYGPFGEVVRTTGPMAKANPIRFSTKYDDDESDLLYYGYRYYKASTGTWFSRDPIEESGGNNLYGFVTNNPVQYADVLGLNSVAVYSYPTYSYSHAYLKITIIPGSTCYPNDVETHTDPDGNKFYTIGGHPGRFAWYLNGKLNDPSDVGAIVSGRAKNRGAVTLKAGDRVLELLLLYEYLNYTKKGNGHVQYSARPIAGSNTYNSNSYCSGMINDAKASGPDLSTDPTFVGWDDPVPALYFEP